jgi:hypothetical protein
MKKIPETMRKRISTPLNAQQIGGFRLRSTYITVNLFLEIALDLSNDGVR